MPKVYLEENRDKALYDTHVIEPGQKAEFFNRECDIGNEFRTNMQMRGQVSSDQKYYLFAIGLRILGASREEECQLLDHLLFSFYIGDMPQWDCLGPQASMMRDVIVPEEIEWMRRLLDKPVGDYELASRGLPSPGSKRLGYCLARPLCIPVRQNFSARVHASPDLPRTVKLRAHLFGMLSRTL